MSDYIDTLLAEFGADAGRHGEGAALSQLQERLRGHDATAWALAVAGLLRAGFSAAAGAAATSALRHFPQNPQLHYWHGNVLRVEGRVAEAEQVLRDLLRAAPQHRDAALSLAFMLREQGRYAAAAQVLVASTNARAPDRVEIQATLAFLRECGAFDAALTLAQAARAHWPDSVEIAALVGEFALALGQFDLAAECLRQTLPADPRRGASWLRLSRCQRYRERGDADVMRFEAAWNAPQPDAQTRTCIGFALGKARDDLGDFAGAAQVLREANALARAATPWDRAAWEAFVAQQMAWTPVGPVVDDGFTPLFIVGLPRTGTTLAATQLARAADVRDRGELNWIGAMHAHLSAQDALHDSEALRATAALVAIHMRRDDAPARWYLDKNPLNFRYLGLIAALFPRARIVHCRRDRRDTALSLWMQHFDHPDAAFAYAFDDIAAYARGYDALMTHWRATLRLPLFELDYEALVTDAEGTLARLTEFLGGARVAPDAASTAIATASVWQARQPVHRESIERWRQYVPHVPELASF